MPTLNIIYADEVTTVEPFTFGRGHKIFAVTAMTVPSPLLLLGADTLPGDRLNEHAQALKVVHAVNLVAVDVANVAQPLTEFKSAHITPVTTIDTAGSFRVVVFQPVTTTEVAQALTHHIGVNIAFATTIDSALGLFHPTFRSLVPALEFDIAMVLKSVKIATQLGIVNETVTALAVVTDRRVTIVPVVQPSTAQPLTHRKFVTLPIVLTTDTARELFLFTPTGFAFVEMFDFVPSLLQIHWVTETNEAVKLRRLTIQHDHPPENTTGQLVRSDTGRMDKVTS